MTEQEILEENKKLRLENAEILRLLATKDAFYRRFIALIAELHEATGEIIDKEIER